MLRAHHTIRALVLAGVLGLPSQAAFAEDFFIELHGAVGLISPIDVSVGPALDALGVALLSPVTATIVFEETTPGTVDPVSGKTIYDFSVLDAFIEIGDYEVTHAPGMPLSNIVFNSPVSVTDAIVVGDDKEGIATPTIGDTILIGVGGLDTDGILSPNPPDEGVSFLVAFGAEDVLSDQSLVTDQATLDAFLDSGGAIEAQIGSPKGFIRIGFDEVVVPEPGPTLLLAIGALVLAGFGTVRRARPEPAAAGTRGSRAPSRS